MGNVVHHFGDGVLIEVVAVESFGDEFDGNFGHRIKLIKGLVIFVIPAFFLGESQTLSTKQIPCKKIFSTS